jgi:adenylate cyclase
MAAERIERKLAAIVAADVAGYSRLMAADEEGTLARLKGHRKALIDPKIAEHGGRIIKTTGDGMLVEFASVVDAVRCVVEIQRGMLERNADIPPDTRIDFRVGVNVGDVIVDGDDIFGDGVNVAARLEGLAEPGGILVAGVVRDQVRDKLSFSFDDLGDRNVKNIPRPVRAYRVKLNDDGIPPSAKPAAGLGGRRIAGIAAAALLLIVVAGGAWYVAGGSKSAATVAQQSAASPPPAEPARPLPHLSIVVLPFANLSGDAAQDYFADGVTESLTTDLSRISGSFVIARNTAFTFKGKNVDAKEIGKAARRALRAGRLGAARPEPHVRVNAQLIDAESGGHLWAERFDEPLSDLFALQDKLVAALASQLGAELMAPARPGALERADPRFDGPLFSGCGVGEYKDSLPRIWRKRAASSNGRWRSIQTISTLCCERKGSIQTSRLIRQEVKTIWLRPTRPPRRQ